MIVGSMIQGVAGRVRGGGEVNGSEVAAARDRTSKPVRFAEPQQHPTLGRTLLASLNALNGQNADLRNPGLTTDAERAGLAIKTIVDLANKHQLWTDIHLHYRTDTQLEDALYALDNPGEYSFDEPDFWACTEWSPTPSNTWLLSQASEFALYFDNGDTPAEPWDDYVYHWGGTPGGHTNGLARSGFPDFYDRDLTEMLSYNMLMACYGEFWHGTSTPTPDAFDLTVVRANKVYGNVAWISDYTNLWTKIREDLQDAAYGVLIDDFDPHATTPSINCSVIVPRP